jgi:hypothetical protein
MHHCWMGACNSTAMHLCIRQEGTRGGRHLSGGTAAVACCDALPHDGALSGTLAPQPAAWCTGGLPLAAATCEYDPKRGTAAMELSSLCLVLAAGTRAMWALRRRCER